MGPHVDNSTVVASTGALTAGSHGAFAIRKNFYAYKHFTAFVRPGSTVINTLASSTDPRSSQDSGPLLLAAINPLGHAVLVITNEDLQLTKAVAYSLVSLAAKSGWAQDIPVCVQTHRTDEHHNCQQLPSGSPTAATFSRAGAATTTKVNTTMTVHLKVPPRSITTIVVSPCADRN